MRISVHTHILRGLAELVLLIAAGLCVSQALPVFAQETSTPVTNGDREFWSFQRVRRPPVPPVQHVESARTPVDCFLLEQLEAKQLAFSADADKQTLIRRVCLDLTGLPPSPAEVEQFLTDDAPDAYERLVDRLLDSPHFGERWARHWLDVVGYVDTVGFDVDPDLIITTEGKWRYRDYVIQSFNDDKPYDRFVTEQLAGDELVDWRPAAKFTPDILESLVATGYLRTAQDFTHEDVGNIPQNYFGILHDTIEIVGSSLLGLTLNCARCHDHKFDPVPQEDYYRLMAVLTTAYNPTCWKIVFPYDKKIEDRALADISLPERAAIDRHNAELDAKIGEVNRQLDELRRPYREQLVEKKLQNVPEAERAEMKAALKVPPDQRSEAQKRLAAKYEGSLAASNEEIAAILSDEHKRAVETANTGIANLNKERESYGKIQALYDVGEAPVTHRLVGGNFETPGAETTPGAIQVLCDATSTAALAEPTHFPGTSGRRLALAHWLTKSNSRPAGLMARVHANRIWQHLLGVAIVPTPENFGVGGESPTHPELLEWLAAELMDNGWRIKPIVRLTVLSTAYRQSTEAASGIPGSDPDNGLLWRMRLKRLESEAIRDSVLAASDTIDVRLGGPPIMLEYRTADGMIIVSEKQLPHPAAKGRRSVYLLARRAFGLSDLAVFDQPVVATNCPQRGRSAVPLQSLSMLNGEFLWEQSERLADRLGDPQATAREQQIAAAFARIFARGPTPEEADWSVALLDRQAALYRQSGAAADAAADATSERKALVHLCHTLLNASEFLYVP